MRPPATEEKREEKRRKHISYETFTCVPRGAVRKNVLLLLNRFSDHHCHCCLSFLSCFSLVSSFLPFSLSLSFSFFPPSSPFLSVPVRALSSSVCGSRHFATHLMALTLADKTLMKINQDLMLGETPDELDLAECIDSLTRLYTFANSLGLGDFAAERMLAKQTMAVARACVALGDVKSVKFGREWAEKCRRWVEVIDEGGDGVRRVWEKLWEAEVGGEDEETKKGGGGGGGGREGGGDKKKARKH